MLATRVSNKLLYSFAYNSNIAGFLKKIVRPTTYIGGCSFVRNYAAPRKRFYRNSSILESENGCWEVTLDQRRVKTPAGQVLRVENETLAVALSNEWDAQHDFINMSGMHLHGLSCTAMDNPNKLNKLNITESILSFLETDTVLYINEDPPDLVALQTEEWAPLIDWFNLTLGVNVEPTTSMELVKINSETRTVLSRYLMSHSFVALHGFSFAVEALKSVILAVACVQRRLPVEKAVLLSRLEEDFQSSRWGRVEWSHDLSQQDIQARVSAATLLVHLSSGSFKTKVK